MSSSRVHTTFTGLPTAFDVSTASVTKSRFAAPAEAAAEIRRVDLAPCLPAGPMAAIAACCDAVCPCVGTQTSQPSALHVRRAVHRLHRRVREERHFEHALERLRVALCERGVGVAVVARDLARLLRELRVLLA